LRNIIVDVLIVAMCVALAFYLALQSVGEARYAGAGFRYDNGILAWGLLIIFALGMFRLVVDLRHR